MRLKLDLDGIIFQLQIRDYRYSSKEDWDSWCKTDFSFTSGDWLKYSKQNDEVFLSCEIEELANKLDKLLKDELTEVTEMEFIEPDFKLIFHPKKDLKNDPKYSYVKKGFEIVDVSMEWTVTFWHEGLTNNYLSVEFDRDDIHYIFNYLNLIMGKIDKQSKMISEMLAKGIIFC
ncbi:MAG: hypothetical protein WC147_03490 [Syntrophomonas sp.]|nr:hypothetical protein [Fermentimonas sp.]